MNELTIYLAFIAIALMAGMLLFRRFWSPASSGIPSVALASAVERLERGIQEGFRDARRDTADSVQRLSDSLLVAQTALGDGQAHRLDRVATELSSLAQNSGAQSAQLRADTLDGLARIRDSVQGSLDASTDRFSAEASQLRTEVRQVLQESGTSTSGAVAQLSISQVEQLREFGEVLERTTTGLSHRTDTLAVAVSESLSALRANTTDELSRIRQEAQVSAGALREGLTAALADSTEVSRRSLSEMAAEQRAQLDGFRGQVEKLRGTIEGRLDVLRGTVDERLRDVQQDNATRLEQMRQTVEEKLQTTLESRLGESFRQVSERLEQVARGLGEMQTLATGVGDLKRVLANVKTRGTWGEVQLENLLEQALAREQYAANVATKELSGERVEFAVRLPGRGDEEVWLPIDAKFPLEDYQALVDASDRADVTAVEEATRRLEARVKASAKDVSAKYLNPPRTTDFVILFLPVEGLYAEVLRRPGLADTVQREYRVMLAGPTTLWAILNSLQMGFKTLAIERRSSEVWALLGAVKTEFGKFGTVLDGIQKNLNSAASKVENARRGTRTITRKLGDVQQLPSADAVGLLDGMVLHEVDAEQVGTV